MKDKWELELENPMALLPNPETLLCCANSRAAAPGPYPPELERFLNAPERDLARAAITAWEGYAPTDLVALPGLAAAAGFARLWYKDESQRFGLGSFKALGGAYAVERLLAQRAAEGLSPAETTVCCATDGNHGRSVAWGAQRLGCPCVIYLHATVSEGRQRAIENYGAEVRRVAGNYDDSVHKAAEDAAANGWFVISDTSYPGYMEVPRDVMHGYMVMAEEVIAQLPAGERPSHVFVQGGVGGLAAAVMAQMWLHYGAEAPRMVVVEPDEAACLYASAVAGEPTVVPGELDTMMAGLAAGEVSLLAWEILDRGAAAFLALPDAPAADLMRLLAEGVAGDPPVVAGESAVAGLAGAIMGRERPDLAAALGLDGDSRVLVFGSEGATDPELYEELVGKSAEQVLAAGP